ncbi:MAG: PrsW family intramembrane metalloprotease [Phycicoccus sp.]|nr:PrsW family intramembrane metalloprotease [Phycicoccus sp.]
MTVSLDPTSRGGRHAIVTARPVLRRTIVGGLIVTGFLVAGLVVAAYFGATFGIQAALVSLLVAILPVLVVVPTFMWLDRYEAEPTAYLVMAFLWGALVATIVSATINTSAMVVLQANASNDDALVTTAVFVAPVIEEAAKGVFVLCVWWFLRSEFDGVIDGMVYGGITAAGFAFTENIQYFAQAWLDGGGEAFTATFIGRGIMSPFAHPIFTVMTGIGIGVAAMSRSWIVRLTAPVLGYGLAVLSHSLWNLAAVSGGSGMGAVYLLVEFPIFLAWLGLIVWARSREGRLIGIFLRPYADAGWLSPAEVQMLSSMGRRREARRWAKFNGGPRALKSMEAFQDTASELALLRRRMTLTPPSAKNQVAERQLLENLVVDRQVFAGAGLR